jgi:hypothetical protein
VFRHGAHNHLRDADRDFDGGGRFSSGRVAEYTGWTKFLASEDEKKNDRVIDRAYQSAIKRLPDAEKPKSDPWGDVRSAPPAAAKNKQ